MLTCTSRRSVIAPSHSFISKRVFEILGFTEEVHDSDLALKPPVTDTVSPQGKLNRKKLLRAWVEIGAWVVDYRRRHCK